MVVATIYVSFEVSKGGCFVFLVQGVPPYRFRASQGAVFWLINPCVLCVWIPGRLEGPPMSYNRCCGLLGRPEL